MKKVLLYLVRGYQKFISPLFPPSCRYYPTCSNYTVQAIEKHGALKGGVMGLARIIRCNPFVPGGVDHVPDHFTIKRNPDDKNKVGEFVGYSELSPKEEEKVKERYERIYQEYKDQVVVHENLPKTSQILNQFLRTEEHSLENLDASYLEVMNETIIEYTDLEELDVHLLEVVRDEKTEKYFDHVHHNLISHALTQKKHSDAIGVIFEETFGIWETNSPQLETDFILKRGVTKKDIDDRTPRFYSYLLTLREEVDDIAFDAD